MSARHKHIRRLIRGAIDVPAEQLATSLFPYLKELGTTDRELRRAIAVVARKVEAPKAAP